MIRSIGCPASALSGIYSEVLVLGHDLDQVPGLSAERDALWARVGTAGFLTDAEKREAVGYGNGG